MTDHTSRQGDLLPMMQRPKPDEAFDIATLPSECGNALTAILQEIASRSWFDEALPAGPETYNEAIRRLIVALPDALGQQPTISDVIGWPVFLLPEFTTALRARDPLSIVILAYYGAALHTLGDTWWLKGIGARLVRAVEHIMDAEMHHLMQWAVEYCNTSVDR